MHGDLTSWYFVPSLPYLSTGGFGLYFKVTGMCSVLLCLHLEQPVSGSEEGGSQMMRYTEHFFRLCLFFDSWVQGTGTHRHDLDQM